ncbi:MAG: hypothetical protein DMG76_03665 [Acidobacteria bacterium]|nr:MAG: hypothetical protein DMG76_03665 [Acidobacteriota bacterium]
MTQSIGTALRGKSCRPLRLRLPKRKPSSQFFAEVPGFAEKDLEVRVEPHRLLITGKRERVSGQKEGKTVYSERHSARRHWQSFDTSRCRFSLLKYNNIRTDKMKYVQNCLAFRDWSRNQWYSGAALHRLTR